MKIIFLLFILYSSTLHAQHISVDSLKQNGYRVRIYKPERKSRVQTIIRKVHDTIYIPIVRMLIVRDTIMQDRIQYYYIEKIREALMPSLKADEGELHTLLIGNANTNGYGMHLGLMLNMGERISFFIGGGMGYNSVTKITHLDLAGQLVIRVW